MAQRPDNGTKVSYAPLPLYPFANRSKASVLVEIFTACLLIVIGATGNSLVCFVIHRSRRTKSSMYYFMASLAYADLLVCCVSVPLTIISTQPEPLFPTMSTWVCKAIRFIQYALPPASVAILTATALDRYFHICHPLKFVITTRRTKWLASCCWVFAVLITIPVPLLLSSRPTRCRNGNTVCNFCSIKEAAGNEIAGSVYLVGRVIFSFMIPEAIIIFLYYKVAKAVWDRGASASSSDKINIIKSLTMVVVAFSLSWAPFSLITKYHIFKHPGQHTISTEELITFWLGLCASVYNPFIYTFYNRNFREAFREVCLGKKTLPPGCAELPPSIPARPRYLSMPDIRAFARRASAEIPTPRLRAVSFSMTSSRPSVLQTQIATISELHALFDLKSPATQAAITEPFRSCQRNASKASSRRNSDPNKGPNLCSQQDASFDVIIKCHPPKSDRRPEANETETPLVEREDPEQSPRSKSREAQRRKKATKNGPHRVKRLPRPRLRIELASFKSKHEPDPKAPKGEPGGQPNMELLEVPTRSDFLPRGRRAIKSRSTSSRRGDRPQHSRTKYREVQVVQNNNSDVIGNDERPSESTA